MCRDQRSVPPVRHRHRLRHPRRAGTRPGAVSRRVTGPDDRLLDGVHPAPPAGRPRRPVQLVAVGAGGQLAAPAWCAVLAEGARRPPGRPRGVGGRRGVRGVGEQGDPDRGRVGVRGAWRSSGYRVRVGRRTDPRGAVHGQLLAGRVPAQEPAPRRVRVHRAGAHVPAERIRAVPDDRQRLGVDGRLVPVPRRDQPRLLHRRQPARGRRIEQPRSASRRRRPDPAQGHEGRVAPVRRELLPALPTGGPDGAGRGHVHVAPRLPLRRARRVEQCAARDWPRRAPRASAGPPRSPTPRSP